MLPDRNVGFVVTASIRGTVEFDTPPGGQISVLGLRANGGALTSLPVLANVGSTGGALAQVASGGGWATDITLVNTGATSASATLNFFNGDGSALLLPLSFPQTNGTATESSVSQTIPAGATLLISTQNSVPAVAGSAQLTTTGAVTGFAIFRSSGQEAVVPLEAGIASSYTLAFDNTGNLATGVALANSSGQAAQIPAILRDSTGATLATTTVSLPPNGHNSLLITDPGLFPQQAAGIRGTLEFDTPTSGHIGALGIRATPAGAFTSIPAMTAGRLNSPVAERALAQTGLAIGQATMVLQSQVAILNALLGGPTSPPCAALPIGDTGRVEVGATANAATVYYDAGCTRPYIVANTNWANPSNGVVVASETAVYYGPTGTNLGTMALNESIVFGDSSMNVYGLGSFTPASGVRIPAQLGLYCVASSSTEQCAGGIAQDFPALGLAIGAVTPITATLSGYNGTGP